MNSRVLHVAFPVFLFACASALADDGKVTILSPADGAVVSIQDKVTIRYKAVWGPHGNHLHVYLDGRRMDVVREPEGSDDIRILLPGKHQICLAIETRWHFPTGVQQCINVTAR